MRYSVVLYFDEDAQVWAAEVPAMDGAVTSGETVEEALDMARDLIEGRIASHRKHNEPVPVERVPVQVHCVEVAVDAAV